MGDEETGEKLRRQMLGRERIRRSGRLPGTEGVAGARLGVARARKSKRTGDDINPADHEMQAPQQEKLKQGDEAKSGGIATNIGVHFFDMLGHVFGAVKTNIVHHRAIDCAAGYIEYERARVRWFLSINARDVPPAVRVRQTTFRSITVDGDELEFSDGFTDLHTDSYREIMAGRGFRVKEARPSIETVAGIRTASIAPADGEAHPLLAEATTGERYSDGWPV